MAGVTRCKKHGRQGNRLIAAKLRESVCKDKFIHVQKCSLIVAGVEASFYFDVDTATKLGATNGNTKIINTLEEFDAGEILAPICRECFNDYLIKYPHAMNKKN